jgi:hypothetical protein
MLPLHEVSLWHGIRVDETLIGCDNTINCWKQKVTKVAVVDGEGGKGFVHILIFFSYMCFL